jgi:hypothetical protein
MYFMSGDSFQVDQGSRLPCSYNVDMVKGYARARETIEQAHIYKIGNFNEIGGGVRIEVHKLYEAVFLKRENTVSGFVRVNGKKKLPVSSIITKVASLAHLPEPTRVLFARHKMCH